MSSPDLATQLEMHLLCKGGWVPVAEICAHLGINERDLRATGRKRAIFARFAISNSAPGRNGLKHISLCSVAERLAYKHNRLRRLVAETRALRDYDLAVTNCLTGKRRQEFERHTGQSLLPL
jgi:hypothetical protein